MAWAIRHRRPVSDTALIRLLATSVLTALLAAGAHVVAGGALPRTPGTLLGVAGLLAASAWLAREAGRRTRGVSATAALVLTGQGGLELLVWCSGQRVRDPLLAVGAHAVAALVLIVLTLGIERVVADLCAAADRSVPVLCWSTVPEPAVRHAPVDVVDHDPDPAVVRWWAEQRPVRGPPLPL